MFFSISRNDSDDTNEGTSRDTHEEDNHGNSHSDSNDNSVKYLNVTNSNQSNKEDDKQVVYSSDGWAQNDHNEQATCFTTI